MSSHTDPELKCVICKRPATTEYQGEPSCGKIACELEIQRGLDYISEIGDR